MAVSPSGGTLWQVNTGSLMYKDEAGNKLYLSGDANGSVSDHLNQLLILDLPTGGVIKQTLK